MKRSLLVAALATLGASAAFAQSTVTVYGRLNTSIEAQKGYPTLSNPDGERDYVVANNGSRLGFLGTEDLGGGLKAGFTMEHRFNSDDGRSTNGDAFWGGAGEASVFLGGNWGRLKAGLFTSESYFATSDVTDMLNHGTGTSADALYRDLGSDGNGNYGANKISYRTPTFSYSTWAELAVQEGDGGDNAGYDFAVNSTFGNLGMGFGYQYDPFKNYQFAVRASYDASPFVVTGYIQQYHNEEVDDESTIFRISAMYTMGAIELHGAYAHATDLGDEVHLQDQFTVGANYNLSKRTKVYAYYNRNNWNKGDNTDQQALSAGIRHNF